MLRLALGATALACFAAAAIVYFGQTSSYSSYSGDQLTVLEQEAGRVGKQDDDTGFEARVTSRMLEGERLRRWLPVALCGVGAVLLAVIIQGPRRRRPLMKDGPAEARLPEYLAARPDEEALRRAAEALGVSAHAPPAVIDAAFEAQMNLRDPGKYESGSMHARAALEQRATLTRARDLLRRRPPG